MIAAAVHGQRLPGSRFVDVTCSRRKQLVGRKMLPLAGVSAALRNRSSLSNANATAVDGGGATAMGCADDAQLGTPPTPQFEPEFSCLLHNPQSLSVKFEVFETAPVP